MNKNISEVINIRKPINIVNNGRVVEIFRGDKEIKNVLGSIQQVSQIRLKPKELAGNHVHEKKHEILYLVEGLLKVIVRNSETQKKEIFEMASGDKISMFPGLEHLFINSGKEDALFIEFANIAFDINNMDSKKVDLL